MTNEYEKPRKFRSRKKEKPKFKDDELHHPVHQPYQRNNSNWRREIDDATKDSGTNESVLPPNGDIQGD